MAVPASIGFAIAAWICFTQGSRTSRGLWKCGTLKDKRARAFHAFDLPAVVLTVSVPGHDQKMRVLTMPGQSRETPTLASACLSSVRIQGRNDSFSLPHEIPRVYVSV